MALPSNQKFEPCDFDLLNNLCSYILLLLEKQKQ